MIDYFRYKKLKPTRSDKIRKSAKGKECTLQIHGVCNQNPETVVLCHLSSPTKGMGIKSDDHWGVYGCSNCHAWLDGNYASVVDRQQLLMNALYWTQKILIEEGLITIE